MKFLISQLSPGENQFAFTSERDGWMKELVGRIESRGYHVQGELASTGSLTKLEPDYYLKGTLTFAVQQTCARCAETFALSVRHPYEVALAHVLGPSPTLKSVEQNEELDVNFFEGPEIDLSPILEEQFFLSLPYQSLCQADCKGVCQHCGKNLNQAACACSQAQVKGPFAVLEGYKC